MIRMSFLFALCAVFFLACPPASAAPEDLTVGLAADRVDITSGFSGAKITLFGVKSSPGDIAVVVFGPQQELRVRRKESVLGLWMNRRSITFHSVPVYYDYALSRKESDIAPLEVRREGRIGLDALTFDPETTESAEDLGKFQEGLIRSQQIAGRYPLEAKPVIFLDDRFFRATLDVPATVPTGEYTIRTFLIRDGRIAESRDTLLRIAQIGVSARIYLFAHESGFFYGLCAVVMAVAAGLSAHVFLRRD